MVRRKVYARFLDAVNFVNGNSEADPEQEVISRWRIEQCSELSAVSASFVLSTRLKRMALFSGTYHAGQHLHLDLSRR
ncbi:phage minor tail L family protein [Escherichia coli]|nr:phage minor tail L family protein [Escherichia coli]